MANFRKKFKNKIFPQKSFTSTLRLHVAVTYAKTPKNYILWLLIKLEKPHFGPILSTLNGNFYKKNLALLLFKGRWNSNYMQNIRKFLNETPQKKRVFRRISTSLVKKYFYRNRSRNWISPIFFIAKKKNARAVSIHETWPPERDQLIYGYNYLRKYDIQLAFPETKHFQDYS